MFNIDKTKNLKIITVDKKIETSIKRIVYLPTSEEDHKEVKFYLDVVGVNLPSLVPREIVAGDYLNEKLYQEVLVENPKTEEDFLKSKSFAIPLTDNPVITQLYYLLYKDGASHLKEISPLFNCLLNAKESQTITPLMLIAFLEANLNAENSKKPDLESHARFLLYKYMEHLFIFDQFMTCEQKCLEMFKGGHHVPSHTGPISYVYLDDISEQIWDGIIPFMSRVFIRKQQLPFVKKHQLPFRLPFINKIYIKDNSLDIRLNGEDWRIINDIDLLIKSLNFLANKNLAERDGGLLTYRSRPKAYGRVLTYTSELDCEEDFYNIFCKLRGDHRKEFIKRLDKNLIRIKKELDINR